MDKESQWWPVALLSKLKEKPQRFILCGQSMVVYRGESGWVAQDDSCPHRNYPLSKGKIVDGKLACAYHGWQFDGKGCITNIPGLPKQNNGKACLLKTHSVHEYNNLLWVCLEGNATFGLKCKPLPNRRIFSYRTTIQGETADILENFLDPMHTAFLHDGLIRSSAKPRKTKAEIRAIENGVEVKYTEETHQSGVIGSVFGRFITHSYGRLSSGNIIDLEFYSSKGLEMTNRFIIVPSKAGENQFFSQITASNRWVPSWLKVYLLGPLFLMALRQDKKAIKIQNENKKNFNKSVYNSTYLDIMRPYIEQMTNGQTINVIEKDIEFYI